MQENAYNPYPGTNTSLYKFAVSEPGSFSYYEYGNGYVVDNHIPETDEYDGHMDSLATDDQATVSHAHQERNSSSTSHARPIECTYFFFPPLQWSPFKGNYSFVL